MDKAVARYNIDHFKRRLAEENDEPTRQLLVQLLAEEEAKLAVLQADSTAPDQRQRR